MAIALLATAACSSSPAPPASAAPTTLEGFKTAVQEVLTETGVPGAGIALVRLGGVEWAGGIGLADRDRGIPVTADTHFRAGSISKTFIATALVQMTLDDDLDLDDPVGEVAPSVHIENPWESDSPVRVIHLLQHTAGFDDMHFNEMYNLSDEPDLPLDQVLRINPRSRRVRWRPGTRVAYSNPGYAVAGYVLEFQSGQPFEDVIAEKIFEPTGMASSSFRLTPDDEKLLARGYRDRSGPPVAYPRIYLRPAGNLHTTPADLGRFVQLLLNWGETAEDLVVDPEYLSNMEHPRASLASDAGLHNGYGSGIASLLEGPFPLLGHGGGIEGFLSQYAYSIARDVGYVVLLNSTHSRDAMRRIQSLAIQYLKADVEPPPKPQVLMPAATLRKYAGYYHDANPRNQAFAFIDWLRAGRTIAVEGEALYADPIFGPRARLFPVTDKLFRYDGDVDATRVFTEDEAGTMVMTGGFAYAERRSRWPVEIVRWPVLISFVIVLTPLAVLLIWIAHGRRAEPAGFWWLKGSLVLCAAAVAVPIAAVLNLPNTHLGLLNVWTGAMFAGSLTLPAAGLLTTFFTIDAWRNEAGWSLGLYAPVVAIAALVLSAYLWSWGMIGFMPWNY
jgi:CubicO group peptidase (beta-lactamase class C family)